MLSIINRDCMVFDLEADSKNQVIEQMVQKFDEQGYLSDKALFLKDVLDREEVFPTYLDSGIGLPHGKSDGTKQAGICVARLKKPVLWDDEDNMVDMVFMIAVKMGCDNNLHLQILARLSRALMHEEFIELIKQGNIDEVYQVLKKQLED